MLCYVRTTQAGAQVPDLSIENLCGYQCCLLNFSKGLGHPDIEHKKTSQAVQTHPKAQALCWRPGEHCNPGCYCSHFENCLWFQLQTSEQDFQKVAFPGSAGRHSLHGLHLLLYRNGEMSCCSLLGMLCILRRTDTLFPCNWKPSAVSSKHLLNIWEIWYKLSTWTLGLDLPGLISVYWSRTDDSYLSSPVPHFLSLCTLIIQDGPTLRLWWSWNDFMTSGICVSVCCIRIGSLWYSWYYSQALFGYFFVSNGQLLE